MGARQSKRSVDITTTPKKEGIPAEGGVVGDAAAPGDGKLERIEEADTKPTTNGIAPHTDSAEDKEKDKDEATEKDKEQDITQQQPDRAGGFQDTEFPYFHEEEGNNHILPGVYVPPSDIRLLPLHNAPETSPPPPKAAKVASPYLKTSGKKTAQKRKRGKGSKIRRTVLVEQEDLSEMLTKVQKMTEMLKICKEILESLHMIIIRYLEALEAMFKTTPHTALLPESSGYVGWSSNALMNC